MCIYTVSQLFLITCLYRSDDEEDIEEDPVSSFSLQPAASYFDAVSSTLSLSQFFSTKKAIAPAEQLLKLIPSTC